MEIGNTFIQRELRPQLMAQGNREGVSFLNPGALVFDTAPTESMQRSEQRSLIGGGHSTVNHQESIKGHSEKGSHEKLTSEVSFPETGRAGSGANGGKGPMTMMFDGPARQPVDQSSAPSREGKGPATMMFDGPVQLPVGHPISTPRPTIGEGKNPATMMVEGPIGQPISQAPAPTVGGKNPATMMVEGPIRQPIGNPASTPTPTPTLGNGKGPATMMYDGPASQPVGQPSTPSLGNGKGPSTMMFDGPVSLDLGSPLGSAGPISDRFLS